MFVSNHVATVTGIPPYCINRTLKSTPLTASQYKVCWDFGWHLPTTNAAHAAVAATPGISGGLVTLIIIVIALILLARRRGSRNATAV